MMLLALFACGSDEVAWAVHHAAVVPSETGLAGTQTWEFFDAGWAERHDAEHFVCARAQDVAGEVVAAPEGCAGCTVAYALTATELGGDCEGALADDEAYLASVTIGIGEVPPVRPEVHAREHDLRVARPEDREAPERLVEGERAGRTARVRHHAVRAALVAAVLHLEERAGVPRRRLGGAPPPRRVARRLDRRVRAARP
jgi:hypothetical protein